MILDDGGDATLLVHKGVEFEKAARCAPAAVSDRHAESGVVILGVLRRSLAEDPHHRDQHRQQSRA